ncbi:hypothetical protein ASD83_11285 [Devosia sp. Root685]|uniref:sensor histidine kinase n=1 Tax=Devosia sp. Root685 TaxID=1736587 RepID=UPI0006F864DD|nr:ATP-binding protein [Devosia sp. Root685]KRA97679.1 hypothetical protein ASD83_11285 [Devosia sp. Root685]
MSAAILLAAIWLVSFRIADLFTVFPTYSSVWFLPSGVTMAIVMAAPGWLKLVPLLAHLSIASPPMRQIFDIHITSDFDLVLHSIRIYLIYGGAGFFLTKVMRITLPFRTWHEVQWFIGTAIGAASVASAAGIAQSVLLGELDPAHALPLAEPWFLGDALGAIMVPPMLIPAILLALGRPLGAWRWPSARAFAMQAATLSLAALIGALGPTLDINLWYLVLPSVLVFALRGGFEHAAAAAFLTCVLTPPVAMIFTGAVAVADLPALLLTTAIAALLVGAATTERQQTAERLEALVAQRTEELEKAYELQRHLVRSLGHDLRQPVEAINLTVAAVDASSDIKVRNTALARVRQLGTVTSDLLTRILAYARLDTGDISAELAPLHLAQLMDRLRATYTPRAQHRAQRLIWPDTDLTVISDRDLLFQILSNHLDNAIRLTPEGGTVEVRIEPGPAGVGIFVIDGFEPSVPHQSSRGGLGLRIVTQAAGLLGAEMVDEQNRKGIILPPKR